jgi:NitT/TauT family transport system ATP-binding protein
MAAGPGRIIAEVPIDIDRDGIVDDLRATPEFVALRHRIWQLFHPNETRGRRAVPQRAAQPSPVREHATS